MNKTSLKIKSSIFGMSVLFLYLIMPDFLSEESTRTCIFVYVIGIGYIAIAGVDVYEFYKGEEFSPGIQMYKIKPLKEDSSSFNIWHRRIGVVVLVLLALVVFLALFSSWICAFVP